MRDTQSKDYAVRYGAATIDGIKDHVATIASQHAAGSVEGALAMLLNASDNSAKITITFVIEEDVGRNGEPFLSVYEDTKVDSKTSYKSEPTSKRFRYSMDELPGFED